MSNSIRFVSIGASFSRAFIEKGKTEVKNKSFIGHIGIDLLYHRHYLRVFSAQYIENTILIQEPVTVIP